MSRSSFIDIPEILETIFSYAVWDGFHPDYTRDSRHLSNDVILPALSRNAQLRNFRLVCKATDQIAERLSFKYIRLRSIQFANCLFSFMSQNPHISGVTEHLFIGNIDGRHSIHWNREPVLDTPASDEKALNWGLLITQFFGIFHRLKTLHIHLPGCHNMVLLSGSLPVHKNLLYLSLYDDIESEHYEPVDELYAQPLNSFPKLQRVVMRISEGYEGCDKLTVGRSPDDGVLDTCPLPQIKEFSFESWRPMRIEARLYKFVLDLSMLSYLVLERKQDYILMAGNFIRPKSKARNLWLLDICTILAYAGQQLKSLSLLFETSPHDMRLDQIDDNSNLCRALRRHCYGLRHLEVIFGLQAGNVPLCSEIFKGTPWPNLQECYLRGYFFGCRNSSCRLLVEAAREVVRKNELQQKITNILIDCSISKPPSGIYMRELIFWQLGYQVEYNVAKNLCGIRLFFDNGEEPRWISMKYFLIDDWNYEVFITLYRPDVWDLWREKFDQGELDGIPYSNHLEMVIGGGS
jgi:hypothetical protein